MFGMRPLMTRYEFCLLCADSYEQKGMLLMSARYKQLMARMTISEAEEWI